MNSEMVRPCPMCGRMISTSLTICPGCGERLDSSREPAEAEPEAVREADFRMLLNLLGMAWIGWSLFSGCSGVLDFAENPGFVSPGPLALALYLSFALAWFVSGLAALKKEIWGVYLGCVLSFLLLLTNLFDVNPFGIVVGIGFLLFSRLVLKQYRQLQGSSNSADDD